MLGVSIIILTYNSSKHIERLIKSLNSLKEEIEIIVVDNDSTDDTLALIKSSELKVDKVLKLPENVGFAAGINFGAEKAKGKYLLFINPDAVFENGKLKEMEKVFSLKENIGVVGGKMIDADGVSEKSAGRFFNLLETLLLVLGLDEKFNVRFSPKKIKKVDFVSGGFMMVKKEVFEELNGFDEKFFMYVEDMELCFRAKKQGWVTYFTPEVVLAHEGHGSSNRSFAVINIYKGILYFYSLHKSKVEFKIVKLLLSLKARAIYALGVITKNSYYIDTYRKALIEIKTI